MSDDLRATCERDQYFSARREDAVALARDVVAYKDTLKDGGIGGGLLVRMVEQFGTVWLSDETGQASIELMYAEADDDV